MIRNLIRRLTRWAWIPEIGAHDGMLKLKELHMKDGAMEMEFEQSPELAQYIGTCFASMVVKSENYTEMQFTMHPKWKGERKWITVTVQKHHGKTPHQLRQEAERKVEALQKEVSELRDLCANKGIKI